MLNSWVGGQGRVYYNSVWQAVMDGETQANFRRNPLYTNILEHVSEMQGRDYLALLDDQNILDVCAGSVAADTVGLPYVYDFNGMMLSPTTIRYAKAMQDIAKFFPHFGEIKSVVEIGCGYGGQSRFISEYAKIIRSKLESYTFLDLFPVTMLVRQYLENFHLKFSCEYTTKSTLTNNRRWDFVISNYAFSEFDRPLQDEYLEKVVLRSSGGFLTMNCGLPGEQLWYPNAWTAEQLMDLLPNAAIRREEPLTGAANYILVFGDHNADIGLKPSDIMKPAGR